MEGNTKAISKTAKKMVNSKCGFIMEIPGNNAPTKMGKKKAIIRPFLFRSSI